MNEIIALILGAGLAAAGTNLYRLLGVLGVPERVRDAFLTRTEPVEPPEDEPEGPRPFATHQSRIPCRAEHCESPNRTVVHMNPPKVSLYANTHERAKFGIYCTSCGALQPDETLSDAVEDTLRLVPRTVRREKE